MVLINKEELSNCSFRIKCPGEILRGVIEKSGEYFHLRLRDSRRIAEGFYLNEDYSISYYFISYNYNESIVNVYPLSDCLEIKIRSRWVFIKDVKIAVDNSVNKY